MEPEKVHVSEADLVRNVRGILRRVETGTEVIIERNARPLAVLRPVSEIRGTVSQCIARAKAHEEESGPPPTLDPDFAADVDEIIRKRKHRNPPLWD